MSSEGVLLITCQEKKHGYDPWLSNNEHKEQTQLLLVYQVQDGLPSCQIESQIKTGFFKEAVTFQRKIEAAITHVTRASSCKFRDFGSRLRSFWT